MTEQRRLAAIVAVDVVGYSRLMGRDESGTLAALKALRRELVDPAIAARGGRIVKTTGDGMLLEFASVVDAVRCVLDIQTAMAARNGEIPEDRRIVLRAGVNLGDIIIEGDDIFGDGVNVAARLQEIARPGGIAISRRVHEDVRDRLEAVFEDAGEQTLKNIARPVAVWRWMPGDGGVTPKTPTEPALALPDKPSIAVLPFQNMSGDPEQEYFADGMVEEIITALSRTRWLFVIARNSSFTYKGRAVDVKQVGRELGVRYVLEGSVRKAGDRVRITAQLIDAATGAHLWAERFDGALADIFDLQDQVTASVAGAIRPELERAEIARARRKPTENLDAYDLYLRALPGAEAGSREANEAALRLLYRAIALDPEFAAAYGLAARCYAARRVRNWMVDVEAERAETARVTRRAMELGRDDPATLSFAGFAIARVLGELEEGVAVCERALDLDPHLATAWRFAGIVKVYLGDPKTGIERLTRAIRLSPRDPALWQTYGTIALALLLAGRHDEAVSWAERSIRESPNLLPALRIATAAHALAGRMDEARRVLARVLELDPGSRIAMLREWVPLQRPEDYARYAEGLRLAGLPE
jgi:adenylate cyclase